MSYPESLLTIQLAGSQCRPASTPHSLHLPLPQATLTFQSNFQKHCENGFMSLLIWQTPCVFTAMKEHCH